MERVLNERHNRAEGARQQAEASRVAVQEKLRTYSDSMKKARTEIFVEQETARRRVLDERQTAVSAARVAAQQNLQAAKKALAAEVEAARAQLETSSAVLAGEIAEAILAGRPAGPAAGRGGSMKSSGAVSLAHFCGRALDFLLAALPVLAAEGAEPDPAESTTGLIFRWLNFLLIFGGVAYMLAKHGNAFFRGNAKAIAASITEAQAAKAAADRELREVEAKIARLDQEIAELREAARRNWAVEAERLRAGGQAEIEKINQAARAELEASERAAQHQLRDVAAALSVEQAGALVSSKMNTEVRARLFRAFLDELGRSAN